ncbi:unnamed protein product [Amoebophrya sp. A120]|nr:unnamed protein product [Amoebophrya sp. A120]|eukprot:GSA120T00024587001.1
MSSVLPNLKKRERPASAQVRSSVEFSRPTVTRPQSATGRRDTVAGGRGSVQHGAGKLGGGVAGAAAKDSRPSQLGARPTGGILGNFGIYSDSQKPPSQMSGAGKAKYLTEQLQSAKKDTHLTKQKHMKLAARQKQMERQVQRREKALFEVTKANRNNVPVPVNLLEHLSQANTNAIPLYKRKRQELEDVLREKDSKIAELKKEPLFTKIVELEAILSCYQNEFHRLQQAYQQSLGGSSAGGGSSSSSSKQGSGGEIARQEIAVLQGMLQSKNMEMDALVRKKAKHVDEVAEQESEYQLFLEEYKRVEQQLQEKHAEVRMVYERFKARLEEVKKKEQLRKELEKLEEKAQEQEAVLKKIDHNLSNLHKVHNRLSSDVFQKSAGLPDNLKNLLYRLRVRAQAVEMLAGCSAAISGGADSSPEDEGKRGPPPLPGSQTIAQLMREADTDHDGRLSHSEIFSVFQKVGVNVAPEDVSLLVQHFSGRAPARILDLLALAGLQKTPMGTKPDEPAPEDAALTDINDVDVEDLRMSLKRNGVSYVTFREKLCGFTAFEEFQQFLSQILKSSRAIGKWLKVWELFGAGMILLRVHSWI